MSAASLPDADVRHLVAESFHLSLGELMAPSTTHIAPINTMGCFLLQYILGEPYSVACGSIAVETGSATLTLEAHVENIEAHLYYLWIERVHPNGRVEMVDFGARYWKAWAMEEERLWIGPPPQPFVWEWDDTIDPSRVRYQRHEPITQAVTQSLNRMLATEEPDPVLESWQGVINQTVDHMMATPLGLSFLVERGIAEPEETDEKEGES
jgi:hypothetical protein